MKKIMSVLLAVAVLFAFAACDNSTTSNPYFGQQVQRVVLESAPDYVEGEIINPADVKVIVEYDNGSVILTGEEVGLYNDTNGFEATAGSNGLMEFAVNYGSDNPFFADSTNPAGVKKWTISIPVYAISKVKVDATNGPATIEQGKTYVEAKDLVYSIVYKKGTTEIERAVSYQDLTTILGYTVSATTPATADVDAGSKVLVTVEVKKDAGTNIAETTPKAWYVEVVEDGANVIDTVTITQDPDGILFNSKTIPEGADKSSSLVKNTINDIPWLVTVTFKNGDVATYTGTGSNNGTKTSDTDATVAGRINSVGVKFVDYSNAKTMIADADSMKFNVRITVDPKATEAKDVVTDTSATFATTADYATEIAIVNTNKYEAGDLINIDDFDFYVTKYASGLVYTEEDKKEVSSAVLSNIELVTTSVNWGTEEGNYAVTFKWNGKVADDPIKTKTINVSVVEPETT